jgi:hypothetical protein
MYLSIEEITFSSYFTKLSFNLGVPMLLSSRKSEGFLGRDGKGEREIAARCAGRLVTDLVLDECPAVI